MMSISPEPLPYQSAVEARAQRRGQRRVGEKEFLSFIFTALSVTLLAYADNLVYPEWRLYESVYYVFDPIRYWTLHILIRAALACAICGVGYGVWSLKKRTELLAPAIAFVVLNAAVTFVSLFMSVLLYVR